MGPEALVTYLAVDLPKVLDLQLPIDPLMVERAHCLGTQRDQRGGRPSKKKILGRGGMKQTCKKMKMA